MKIMSKFPWILILVFTTSCMSTVNKAVRDTKYSALEMFGLQKRDLLKKEVKNARDEQKEANEQYKDALDKLKKLYKIENGKFDSAYEKLSDSYEDAKKQSAEVSSSIQKVETIAGDLFLEWEGEIKEISTPELKVRSVQSLNQTKKKYSEMIQVLKAAEKQIPPVLEKLHDHVLYIKHKLNAVAIGALQGESGRIQMQIEKLMADMDRAVKAADQFIKETE